MKSYRIAFSALLLLLYGCTSRAESDASAQGDQISVSIHGVNYTADPFQFSVVDPRDKNNSGGGEHIGPYAAGGIVCCFKLPAKWLPGTTVEIHSKHWPSTGNGKEASAIKTKHTVELPPYANGKAGELWVLRREGRSIDVISSDLQPNHPQWPGKIKGWPAPSREFMLERWELERKYAESDVENYRRELAELNNPPSSLLRSKWEFDKEYRKDETKNFQGPDDPSYLEYKKNSYAKGLIESEYRLNEIMKGRP